MVCVNLVCVFFEKDFPQGIEKYKQVKLKEIPQEICGKIAKIRQYMIESVETVYIAFWDSDDIYSSNKLNLQLNEIERNIADICFSNEVFNKNY